MKKILTLLFFFPFSLLAQSLSSDFSAVVQSQLRVATTNPADASDPNKAIINIDYLDGLGRSLQKLGYKQSPNQKDVVFVNVKFDEYGREVRQTLPTPTSENSGTFKTGVTTLAQNFYGEALPQSEITAFDNSPLNRVKESYGAGTAWRTNQKANRLTYGYNLTNEVRLYVTDVNGNITYGSIYYPEKSLYKTTSIDEQGDSSVVFKDIVGNTIETWQQVGTSEYAKTHFLYFHGDRIKAVIQPEGVDEGTGMANLTTPWDNYVFYYEYDSRGRVVEKKTPGAAREYFVYDKWDKLVASQTGLQRESSKWSFFKYDALGREVYRGEYTNSQSRTSLQASVASFESGQKHLYEIRNTATPVYYTLNRSFPSTVTASDIRHINYYDDYTNWLPSAMVFDAGNAYHAVHPESHGDLTGSKTKKTEDNNWLASAHYFDNKNRLIQTFSENTFGHTERTDFEYLFGGEVSKIRVVHKDPDDISITELTENAYDHAGRLILVKHGINTAADTLCTLSYDELGRLTEKKIRPQYQYYSSALDYIIRNSEVPVNTEDIYRRYISLEPGFTIDGSDPDTYLADIDSTIAGATVVNGLQTINYGYHLRGMLNCVNCENGSPSLSPEDNDLFAYKLDFESKNRFDGNISGQSWRSKLSPNIDSYDYFYDSSKRLIQADFTESKYGIPFIDYDLNGNIKNLHRLGKLDSAYGKIDALVYTYSGNKLSAVADTILGNMNVGDFRDGNTSGNDYSYYTNGNLKSDLNQEITSIQYDSYLNKPTQLTLTGGRWVKYYYDGVGTLLKRKNSTGLQWTYSGTSLYKNDTLYQMAMPEGRAFRNSLNNIIYEFEYRDHLGNLRLSYRDTTLSNPAIRAAADISQTADYMPFGVEHFGVNHVLDSSDKQKFTYSNKEKQDDFGLSRSYFGARFYNSTIGRWDGIDALSENRYWVNQYNYVQNNPINRIDPFGLTDYTLDKKTGDVSQVGDSNDDPDRILKTNRKGVKYRKNGEAKVAIGGIEQGILKDGQNFKTNDNIIAVGGEGQASLEGVEDFVTRFGEYIGLEMSGAYLSDQNGADAAISKVYIDEYQGNGPKVSYTSLTELYRDESLMGMNTVTSFHTHPSNIGASRVDVERPSGTTGVGGDLRFRDGNRRYFHNFLILTRTAAYPDKVQRIDYTKWNR